MPRSVRVRSSIMARVRQISVFAFLLAGVVLLAWARLPDYHADPAERATHPALTSHAVSSAPVAAGMIVPAGFMRGPSGALLPRFAALAAADVVPVRKGPGEEYPLAWEIRRGAVPVEVLAETGQWLRIRDHEGDEGWVHRRFFAAGQRLGMVAPWRADGKFSLREAPDEDAGLRAWLKGEVVVRLLRCDGHWCEVGVNGIVGWIRQDQLWGVYADERLMPAGG